MLEIFIAEQNYCDPGIDQLATISAKPLKRMVIAQGFEPWTY